MKLILEIGWHRYEQAMETMQVNQKPIGMKGWYFEAKEGYVKLCYQYPSRYILMLMNVERFNTIPVEGWIRGKVER